MVELINSFPDFTGAFSDKRIYNRAGQVLRTLTQGRSSSIRQVTASESEQKSFYRLFNNESFSEDKINSSIVIVVALSVLAGIYSVSRKLQNLTYRVNPRG